MSSENSVKSDRRLSEEALSAPYPAAFPLYPQSWYFVCNSVSLAPGQAKAVRVCDRSLVLFRGEQGRLGAMDARCPHLGSNLARGRVVRDAIECPYHRFQFDRDGHCAKQGLRNLAYAVEERFGAIFVYLGAAPAFALPTFGAVDLVSAPPIHWQLETQWYMVGANAFDARHFALAHGRRLLGDPQLRAPQKFCLQVSYEYAIEGHGWVDRVVRLASGPRVAFHVTAWGGNLILVQAKFARDESLGMVVVQPAGACESAVTVIVNARRTGSGAHALLIDWLRVRLKRLAIRSMLQDDARGLQQLEYIHGGLRPGDQTVAAFLRWAATMPGCSSESHKKEEGI